MGRGWTPGTTALHVLVRLDPSDEIHERRRSPDGDDHPSPIFPGELDPGLDVGGEMSGKEKLYHVANVVAIPISALSAILLVWMGRRADAGQISMSDPVMSFSALLLWALIGMGVIWMVASVLIQARRGARARKGEEGKVRTYAGIAAFFVILIALALFTPLWMIGLAAVAVYLFVVSARALITNRSAAMSP